MNVKKKLIKDLKTRLGFVFLLLICGIAGVVMILFGIHYYEREFSIISWPSVKGIIISGNMVGKPDKEDDSICYFNEYEYSYEVDGQKFENDDYWFYLPVCLDEQSASDAFIEPGTAVDVYYNPGNPSDSYLYCPEEMTHAGLQYLVVGFILFVIWIIPFIGLCMTLYSLLKLKLKKRRRKRSPHQ